MLGPIGAERRGEPVALGGPRQRSVLARLALVAGQVVTVDRLIEDVWGGAPPATAVNTLQSYVSLLRRALGDPSLLRRDGPGYVIALGRGELDATRFEDHVARGRSLLEQDPRRALDELGAGLAEWRGPALADVSDEPWARASIARWDEMRVAAIEWRADARLALGTHEELISELERALEEHPLREGLARRLMLALYRSGRQADALRIFARTRQRLAEDVGLDPTPELVSLQVAILNHDPLLTLVRPDDPASSDAGTPPVPAADASPGPPTAPPRPVRGAGPIPLPGPARRAGQHPFVGRQPHLDTLRRIWAEVRQGSPAVVLLAGETGVGKSRLAARFAAEAHEEGALVLWGRATPEAVVPFEPLVEALRTVLRAASPDARRRVVDNRGLLSVLLPELSQMVPELTPARAEPDVERYLLFETITDLLSTESEFVPILVVLDDLQWADTATLALVEHVLRHELPGQVLALGTMRVPNDEPRPEVDRMLLRLEREGVLTKIKLDGLDAAEVNELARAADRDDVDATALVSATGGNAFYVTELLRHNRGLDDEDAIPESVQAMIDQRLDRLDPAVNMVLSLVAVAGQSATLAVLAAAADFEADRLLDAVDIAVSAGLLVEDGAGRFAMPHTLTRQAVLARLSRSRRLDLHRRIGDALEHASEPNSLPETLAYHLLEAGSLTDVGKRIKAGLEAGWRALELATYDEATAWVGRVDALVTPTSASAVHAELEMLRSDTARSMGDRREAVEAARRAAHHARDDGDAMLVARAAEAWMRSMSGVGFDIGRPPEGALVELLTEAIARLPGHERRYGVRLRSMLSSVLVGSNDWDRRETLAKEAMAIAEADGRPELRASALLARRLAWWQLDRLEERAEAALEAVEIARTGGVNLHLELTVMLFALTDLMELGRLDEHNELLARYQARSSLLNQSLYDVYAMFIEAGNELAAGRYAPARRLADDALELGLRAHGLNAMFAHAGVWFRVHHDQGTLATTIVELERQAAEHPSPRLWRVALSCAYALSGRRDDARPVFERLVDIEAVEFRDNPLFLPALCTMVEVAAALGDSARARVLLDLLTPYADRVAASGLGGPPLGPVSRYVGLAALTSGQLAEAEVALRRAVAESARLRMRPYEAASRHDLARTLTRQQPGDRIAAASEEAEAHRIADAIGMALVDW